jgi:WD40 repeat protein
MAMIHAHDCGYNISAEAREVALLDYVSYLLSAKLFSDLQEPLLDFDYIRLKLSKWGPEALIAEFNLALNGHQGEDETANPKLSALALLRDAVNMSAQVIASDSGQIPSQLLGRLQGGSCPELIPLLKSAFEWKDRKWIRPGTRSLLNAGSPLIRVLSGTGRWPKAVAIRPDGSQIFAMCTDDALKIWDTHSGELLRKIKTEDNSDDSMKITMGDKNFVVAFSGGSIVFRDVRDGSLLRTFKFRKGSIPPVITPDRSFVIVTGEDRTMRVFDAHSAHQVRKVHLHKGRITAMLSLPDSKRIASASEDGRIMVWDITTGHNLASLGGHKDSITALAQGWRENDLISASRDRTVRVWDIATRRDYLSLSALEPVVAIDVAKKRGRIVMMCDDGSLGVWDVVSSTDNWLSSGAVNGSLAVTADGHLAVTTAKETLRLWDLDKIKPQMAGGVDSWRFLKLLNKVTGTHRQLMNIKHVEVVSIDQSSTWALTGAFDGDIKRWWLERCEKDDLLLEARLAKRHAALGVGGLLAMRGSSGIAGVSSCGSYINVWDFWGDEYFSWRAHSDTIDALAVVCENVVASAGRNGKIKIWDLSRPLRRRPLRTLRHHWFPWIEKSSLADMIKRRKVLTITSAKLMVWESRGTASEGTYAEGVKPIKLRSAYVREIFLSGYRKHFGGLMRLAIAADGKTCASAAYETVKLWNPATGRKLGSIRCGNECVSALALTPNGSHVLCASGDSADVFDIATGEREMTLSGHKGPIFDLDVTRDGRRALSVSQDCTLKLWELATGDLVATFSADSPLYCCRAAPDCAQIVAGDEMGNVHLLRIVDSDQR